MRGSRHVPAGQIVAHGLRSLVGRDSERGLRILQQQRGALWKLAALCKFRCCTMRHSILGPRLDIACLGSPRACVRSRAVLFMRAWFTRFCRDFLKIFSLPMWADDDNQDFYVLLE